MSNDTTLTTGKTVYTVKPVTAISLKAIRISILSTGLFLFLLIILHLVKPEINPSWRFISEYAIGSNGWIMILAFLALAISYISLFAAIRSQILKTIIGRLGLGLLLVSAAGLTLAGVFVTDPVTAAENESTITGSLHNLGGTLGIAMPFAAILICWQLVKNKNWSIAKRPLQWATVLVVIGFVVAFGSLGVMLSQSGGKFGPDVLVGWPNRFEILTYCIWLLVVAWQARRVRTGGKV